MLSIGSIKYKFSNLNDKECNIVILIGLFIIFIIAIQVRYDYHLLLGGMGSYYDWANMYFFGGISPGYVQGSQRLLQGLVYNDLAYPPGYAIFLAFLQLIHIDNLQTMRIVQGLVDSSCIFALYTIFRWANANRFLSIFGALLYAVVPLYAQGSVIVLAEWISPSIVIWSLFAFTRLYSFNKIIVCISSIFLGLIIAIGAMFRPDLILLFIPFFCANYIVVRKMGVTSKYISIFIMLLAFSSIIGSWGLHNKSHFNHWIFTSTGGGNALWEGLGDITDNKYGYKSSDPYAISFLEKRGMKWHSVKANNYMFSLYLQAWKEHPGYVIKTILVRWKRIINANAPSYFSSVDPPTYRHIISFYQRYGIILLLLALLLFRKDKRVVFLLSLPLLYALFSVGLVHYEPRYTRYANLSYLFATIMILSKVNYWLSKRKSYTKYHVPSVIYLAMILFVLSWPLKIHDITVAKLNEAKIVAQLKNINFISVPHQVITLNDIKWHQMSKNNDMQWENNSLIVTSNVYSFIYYSKLSIKNTLGYYC